uniref:Uncharacterized protein n=1 Tax=Glossina austeni TaxID=7395 RepID=A0A1A9VNZ0_GLOAU
MFADDDDDDDDGSKILNTNNKHDGFNTFFPRLGLAVCFTVWLPKKVYINNKAYNRVQCKILMLPFIFRLTLIEIFSYQPTNQIRVNNRGCEVCVTRIDTQKWLILTALNGTRPPMITTDAISRFWWCFLNLFACELRSQLTELASYI